MITRQLIEATVQSRDVAFYDINPVKFFEDMEKLHTDLINAGL